MAKYVVAFVSEEEPKTYLIGSEDLFAANKQPLFYVFDLHAASLGAPVMLGSIAAHAPGVEWQEYAGSEEEEKAILAKFQQVMADDNKRTQQRQQQKP